MDNFPFIVSSGPRLQNDPTVRTIIRKQAMKDVGRARRKQSVRTVVKQLPNANSTNTQIRSSDSSDRTSSDSSPTNSSNSSTSTDDTNYDELFLREEEPQKSKIVVRRKTQDPFSFSAINLFSNYETARSKFQLDIADLTMLTSFHIGQSAIPIIAADPAHLITLMGYRQWSYLQFVPSRYGSSPCLTAATNCVLGKVKTVLNPNAFQCQDTMLRLYSKALTTLQDAISDESNCLDADVLCATQLLSIHELLDSSRESAWVHHIAGSERLVRNRKPEQFKTEFDKALFAAHVGPVLSQSFVKHTRCYLEDPEWLALYRSLTLDSDFLTERSSLTINIRAVMLLCPGLWVDTGTLVDSEELFEDNALAVLGKRCRKVHQDLLEWTEEYKNHCVRLSLAMLPSEELGTRRELLGTSLESIIVIKRLIATVAEQERQQLETEAQAIACLLLDLQEQPSPKHSWLFTGHEVGIAYTARLTKDQWEEDLSHTTEYERRIASRTRFKTWTGMLGEMGA